MVKKTIVALVFAILLFSSYYNVSYARNIGLDQNGDGYATEEEQYIFLVEVYGNVYNMLWISDYYTGYNPAIPDYKKKSPDELLQHFKIWDSSEPRIIDSINRHSDVVTLYPPSPSASTISEINKSKNAFLKDHPDRIDVYLYGGTTYYNNINYSPEYNAYTYFINNPDLQTAIGPDPEALIKHYVEHGKAEGRISK